jgi:hypothetical protein
MELIPSWSIVADSVTSRDLLRSMLREKLEQFLGINKEEKPNWGKKIKLAPGKSYTEQYSKDEVEEDSREEDVEELDAKELHELLETGRAARGVPGFLLRPLKRKRRRRTSCPPRLQPLSMQWEDTWLQFTIRSGILSRRR